MGCDVWGKVEDLVRAWVWWVRLGCRPVSGRLGGIVGFITCEVMNECWTDQPTCKRIFDLLSQERLRVRMLEPFFSVIGALDDMVERVSMRCSWSGCHLSRQAVTLSSDLFSQLRCTHRLCSWT